ncbi:DUF4249 domain-containing protein [Hymenobacter pini]|uniref:DUF4249 domain-containing protein n=1 Tax=Hymenobacter pini TaxID=2880879 RepID=UPI001CF0F5DC|nr:DUF4249 domain-containing protein [Hymenobacter pini]MCA8831453.1 DUF4249 domain-containing protein [Hymenobacter pini]
MEPYAPKTLTAPNNYLVVDGRINSPGTTTIQLTRSINIADKKATPVESRAKVFIEVENGARYPLTEGVPGTYTSGYLRFDAGKRVRLRFTTAAQRDYASDYTEIKNTPAIDAVSWEVVQQGANPGVRLFVDTHDETGAARYYRWEYEETWAFTSSHRSYYKYENKKIVPRTEDIYHCWGNEPSSAIKLFSTLKLQQDRVSHYQLLALPSTSKKLQNKYSILVKQYALTAEEYAYWDQLRKNTETLGTLYDPLPSQSVGNIHCLTDPDEPVLGFVGAQSMTQQRIFIDYGQLPRTWVYITGYESCFPAGQMPLDKGEYPKNTYPTPEQVIDFFRGGLFIPIEDLQQDPDSKDRIYTYQSADCVDCRRRGSNIKPSFWP